MVNSDEGPLFFLFADIYLWFASYWKLMYNGILREKVAKQSVDTNWQFTYIFESDNINSVLAWLFRVSTYFEALYFAFYDMQ